VFCDLFDILTVGIVEVDIETWHRSVSPVMLATVSAENRVAGSRGFGSVPPLVFIRVTALLPTAVPLWSQTG
jgi:hypothetical protein